MTKINKGRIRYTNEKYHVSNIYFHTEFYNCNINKILQSHATYINKYPFDNKVNKTL